MLLDEATLKKTAVVDPSVAQFLTKNPVPPPKWEDLPYMRGMLRQLSQMMLRASGQAEPSIIEEVREIPMRDGFKSTIKIHRPAEVPSSGSPLIVSFFGGGWCGGDLDSCISSARAYVRLFGATVVAPSYRLAPEYKFPISQYDSWDTVKWLDQHASELGADLTKGFIVSGVSAGATNASVVATHAIEEPLEHPITGQYLDVPSLFDKARVPEKYKPYYLAPEQNKDSITLTEEGLAILESYIQWDPTSPWKYPINSTAPLSKQPPAYIQADGMDILRDDALIWEEILKEAGVKTRIDLYPGCPHAHAPFFVGLEVSNKAIADHMAGVAWLLGKTVTREEALAAMAPRT